MSKHGKVNGKIDLRIDGSEWSRITGLETMITDSFSTALSVADLSVETFGNTVSATVSATVVLSDNDNLQQLNSQWRSKEKPTNVLSFPAPEGERDEDDNRYLGDIILAYGVVAEEAEQQGKALETHLCHLIIHGALHLLGFDHLEDGEAEQMEDLERTAMEALNLPDPYLPVTAKQENTET